MNRRFVIPAVISAALALAQQTDASTPKQLIGVEVGNERAMSVVHLHCRGSALQITQTLKLSPDFVIHLLRHTMLNGWARSAGSILGYEGGWAPYRTVSQRYVDPSSAAQARAMHEWRTPNARMGEAIDEQPLQQAATASITGVLSQQSPVV
ncbi:MAG: hypothetical protein QOJ99_2514 [Bryobacterales bacterium]|nr:hypothetical protein [Bryobacterales bacterium]